MTWDTLLNCISGSAPPAEQQACQAWLAAHSDNRALYQRLQGRYRQRQQPVPADEVARQWAQLQTRLHRLPAGEVPAAVPASARAWSWWHLAAAVLVLAVATVLLVRPRWSAKDAAWTTVRATTQRRLVRLPDGSAVWLARRSSLSYPADFGRQTRPVRLRGAAFFEIQKNPARPFTVQTAGLRVQVLGTSFQVLARDSAAAAVAVATGVVAVQTGTAQHRLYSGQQLTYQPGAAARVTPVSLAAARGLRSDTLQFERSSLPQIARQLSSWYGLPVRLAPGAAAARVAFSGRIPDTGLPQVLEGLSFATDHRFRLTAHHTIVIQPNAQ